MWTWDCPQKLRVSGPCRCRVQNHEPGPGCAPPGWCPPESILGTPWVQHHGRPSSAVPRAVAPRPACPGDRTAPKPQWAQTPLPQDGQPGAQESLSLPFSPSLLVESEEPGARILLSPAPHPLCFSPLYLSPRDAWSQLGTPARTQHFFRHRITPAWSRQGDGLITCLWRLLERVREGAVRKCNVTCHTYRKLARRQRGNLRTWVISAD